MPMPAWLIAVLRVLGIRRAADVVPVATRVGEAIADAIAPDDPGQPLSHRDVESIQKQIGSATSHKVAPCDKPPPGWVCTRERGHPGACAAWPAPPGGTLIIKAAPPRPPRKPTKGT
jgi:hypothetical protein